MSHPPEIPSRVLLSNELPRTVGAVKDGWQLTLQSSAVVTVLLAGIEAQLLSYIRSPETYVKGDSSQTSQDVPRFLNSAQYAVLVLCYSALFLSIGATISAFVMIDKLGHMQYISAKSEETTVTNAPQYIVAEEVNILKFYGVGKSWEKLVWHWFFCFYGGILCIVAQLLTFIALQEPISVKIIVTLIGALSILPPTICLFCSLLK